MYGMSNENKTKRTTRMRLKEGRNLKINRDRKNGKK
jgi:hypothetical protein